MTKVEKATKKIIPLYQHHYEDIYGKEQLLNWPLIRSAEKVASHYTTKQVEIALLYYFSHSTKHSLWNFINEIDKFYSKSIEEDELKENLKNLIEQTKDRMKEFE